MITCEQAKLQIQALLDNEIEEQQIAPLISHLESCYTCRNEYISVLRLLCPAFELRPVLPAW